MSDMIQKVQFKRGTKENLTIVLVGENKPAAGEPIYEIDTGKMKIGDGASDYASLPYLSGGTTSIYYSGYYLNGEFYEDSTYQTILIHDNQKIYTDLNSYMFYRYYGDDIGYKPVIGEATDVTPGLVKLYKTSGSNEDGAMTQKAVTDGVKGIKLDVEYTEDTNNDGKITTDDDGCLILTLPW